MKCLSRKKELIKGKATYDSLAERKAQLEKAVTLAESSAKEMRDKRAALVLMKIGAAAAGTHKGGGADSEA